MSLVHRCWRKKVEILPLLTRQEEKKSQQLDLKPLPVELKYAFLEENKQCPVVISSLLTTPQEDNLLHLLKMNKQDLGWKIFDLKGISPTIYTHHIYLEEESKVVRQPHRRLNPHMQEVVGIKVLKLLQAGIIYPISDSTWVREKITSHCPSLISFLREFLGTHSIAFWMGIQGTFRDRSHQRIKRRPPLLVHLDLMLTGGCLLVSATPLPPSRDVCLVYSVIWWSALWKYTWMTSLYTEVILKNV